MSLILNPKYQPKDNDFIIIPDLSDDMLHVLISSHPEWFCFSDNNDLRKVAHYLEWFMGGFCRTNDLEGDNHHLTTDFLFVEDGYQTQEDAAVTKLLEIGYVWDDKARVWLDGKSAAWIHALSERV